MPNPLSPVPSEDCYLYKVRLLQRYTGFLRNIRLFHFIYNLFHKKGLKHNKHLYPYYGLHKSIYAPVSHRDFKEKGRPPWLDNIVSERDIQNHPLFCHFPAEVEKQLMDWQENGYIIWDKYLDNESADVVNEDIDRLLNADKVGYNYTRRKIFNAYRESFAVRKVIKEKTLLELLTFILDKKVLPFQTLNFLKGSEQKPHSDSLHMTTFPHGYLIAVWIALEDIGDEQGPICYYPGSHRLPYITNDDYENHSNAFMLDGNANKKYEEKVQQVIEENQLVKKTFLAKKGDAFIWHANLIHGGEPVVNPALTRKSMVIHYFADDVIAYHEISERPAIFDIDLVGEIESNFYKGESRMF